MSTPTSKRKSPASPTTADRSRSRSPPPLQQQVQQLPRPDDIPAPPRSTAHKYKIDERERVVRADFSTASAKERIDPSDERYVLQLLERPDLTVIIKGLAAGLDPQLWSTAYLAERSGDIMYHNFRRFCRPDGKTGDAFVPVPEVEKAWSSMRLRDYVRYLNLRAEAKRSQAARAVAKNAERAIGCSAPAAVSADAPKSDNPVAPMEEDTEQPIEAARLKEQDDDRDKDNGKVEAKGKGHDEDQQEKNGKKARSVGAEDARSSTSAEPETMTGVVVKPSPRVKTAAAAVEGKGTPAGGGDGGRVGLEASGNRDGSGGGDDQAVSDARTVGVPEGGIQGEEGGMQGGSGGAGSARNIGEEKEEKEDEDPTMSFVSFDGRPRRISLLKESLYLTDMDLTRYLPECANNLHRELKMDLLPGGGLCATQYMPRESRPFLGPNLYMTPPGSWTQFHQDGNGTVDSGHQCLAGRNRVIMLRRLENETDKRVALRILSGSADNDGGDGVMMGGDSESESDGHGNVDGMGRDGAGDNSVKRQKVDDKERRDGNRAAGAAYVRRASRGSRGNHAVGGSSGGRRGRGGTGNDQDLLYKLPHGPGKKPPWPTDDSIARLRQLNFCPSVFTLEAGEFVHINKGRLHAFRKEEPLPHEDPGAVCVSVAWDWVYKGITEAGCGKELGYALRCSSDNRRTQTSSLAPIETCLLQTAKAASASLRVHYPLYQPTAPIEAASATATAIEKAPYPSQASPKKASTVAILAAPATAENTPTDVPTPPVTAARGSSTTEAASNHEGKTSSRQPSSTPAAQPGNGTTVKTPPLGDSVGAHSGCSGDISGGDDLADGGEGAGNHGKAFVGFAKHRQDEEQEMYAFETMKLLSRLEALLPADRGQLKLDPSFVSAVQAIRGRGDRNPEEKKARKCSTKSNAGEIDRNGDGDGDDNSVGPTRIVASEESKNGHALRGHQARREEDEQERAGEDNLAVKRKHGEGQEEDADNHLVSDTPRSCESAAAVLVPPGPSHTGLDSWIPASTSRRPLQEWERGHSASAMAAARSAAFEVLEVVMPAASEAEAAAVEAGGQPAAAVAAAAAARAAISSARRAATAASVVLENVASQRIFPSTVSWPATAAAAAAASGEARMIEKASDMGVGPRSLSTGDDGLRTGGEGVVGRDRGVLAALAPLLEEITAKQRRDWGLQVEASAKAEKGVMLNPSRPGKRKLGPAAAKARDELILAAMMDMQKPLRNAVSVVEVDSSVPMHLQKINPFSADDGFTCSSCRGEIFNAYMHCFGCETLLSKDLNLCLACNAAGRLAFAGLDDDHHGLTDCLHCPSVPQATMIQREHKAVAYRNTGQWPASRCGCQQPACRECHLCVACACDCHHRFQLRFRFEHPASLERFVQNVRDIVGGASTIFEEAIPPGGTAKADDVSGDSGGIVEGTAGEKDQRDISNMGERAAADKSGVPGESDTGENRHVKASVEKEIPPEAILATTEAGESNRNGDADGTSAERGHDISGKNGVGKASDGSTAEKRQGEDGANVERRKDPSDHKKPATVVRHEEGRPDVRTPSAEKKDPSDSDYRDSRNDRGGDGSTSIARGTQDKEAGSRGSGSVGRRARRSRSPPPPPRGSSAAAAAEPTVASANTTGTGGVPPSGTATAGRDSGCKADGSSPPSAKRRRSGDPNSGKGGVDGGGGDEKTANVAALAPEATVKEKNVTTGSVSRVAKSKLSTSTALPPASVGSKPEAVDGSGTPSPLGAERTRQNGDAHKGGERGHR